MHRFGTVGLSEVDMAKRTMAVTHDLLVRLGFDSKRDASFVVVKGEVRRRLDGSRDSFVKKESSGHLVKTVERNGSIKASGRTAAVKR